MLNISPSEVVEKPFPHVISDQLLDPDLYKALKADFPREDVFNQQKSKFSNIGSRTGQGFDIYRGDSAYSTLIESSKAWAEFDAYINSKSFVEKYLEIFGKFSDDIGLRCAVAPEKYDRSIVEMREVMTPTASFRERLREVSKKFIGNRINSKSSEVDLFSRLDIHRAMVGYDKPVHCDRPNRLCSLIVYFCDADELGIEGGTLTIHKHRLDKSPTAYERHPKPEDAPVVASLRPKENTGVFFPCCNNSYHGVTAVGTPGIPRDYLYINISAESYDLW